MDADDFVVDLAAGESRSLEEAEAKYRALVDHLPGIVYITESGEMGEWLYVSPQIESILGYTPEEWLSHANPFHTFVHPDDLARTLELEAMSRSLGLPYRADYRIIAKDGRSVWIRDEAVLVAGSDGKPLFMQGIMYDRTETTERDQRTEELGSILKHDMLYRIANLRNLAVSLATRWSELHEESRLRIARWIEEETAKLRELTDETLAVAGIADQEHSDPIDPRSAPPSAE